MPLEFEARSKGNSLELAFEILQRRMTSQIVFVNTNIHQRREVNSSCVLLYRVREQILHFRVIELDVEVRLVGPKGTTVTDESSSKIHGEVELKTRHFVGTEHRTSV